jgi:hypothetical protein
VTSVAPAPFGSPASAEPAAAHRRRPVAVERAHRAPVVPPAPPPIPFSPGPAAAAASGAPGGITLTLLALAVMVAASLLGPAAPGGRLATTAVRRIRDGTSRLERPG